MRDLEVIVLKVIYTIQVLLKWCIWVTVTILIF